MKSLASRRNYFVVMSQNFIRGEATAVHPHLINCSLKVTAVFPHLKLASSNIAFKRQYAKIVGWYGTTNTQSSYAGGAHEWYADRP